MTLIESNEDYTEAVVLDVFVPDGGSKRDTAVLLTGTAAEFGLPQRDIRVGNGGYWISERLAAFVYDEDDSETTETSGDNAGDVSTTEQE